MKIHFETENTLFLPALHQVVLQHIEKSSHYVHLGVKIYWISPAPLWFSTTDVTLLPSYIPAHIMDDHERHKKVHVIHHVGNQHLGQSAPILISFGLIVDCGNSLHDENGVSSPLCNIWATQWNKWYLIWKL